MELGDRLRVRYAKVGKIRFTSQRDVARMWERAMRRSLLPVAWTEGFSPRMLLQFSLALPTGFESDGEFVDIRLSQAESTSAAYQVTPVEGGVRYDELVNVLAPLVPSGIVIEAIASIAHTEAPLQEAVTSCSWQMEVGGVSQGELSDRIQRLLDAETIPIERERKGRRVTDDIRPSVLSLESICASSQTNEVAFVTELAMRPRGVRPKELLEGLGPEVTLVRGRRTHQWIDTGDARGEPLSMDGRLPGHPQPAAQGRVA